MTRNLPPEIKTEIRERVDFVAIVSETVRLRRVGANYLGLCPFHKEKTPSFNVVPAKGIFYCFGCNEGGDVFKFVMKRDNLGFPQALERMATLAGVDLTRYQDREAGSVHTSRLRDILEAAQGLYRGQLAGGSPAWAYLTERRGLSEKTIAEFGLGYAPESWSWLVDRLRPQGITDEEMVVAGLARRRDGGDGVYDAFRDRVTFPIRDDRGHVVAFGGRILGDGQPKYLNSPESPVFRKGSLLYNLHRLAGRGETRDGVVLVEGYMDVVGLAQAGVANAVATLGTAMTVQHIRKLARITPRLYLCFDADAAGVKATLRSLELLRDAELEVRVLTITGGKDPDELVKEGGPERWQEVLEGSRPVDEYLFDTTVAAHDLGTADGRRRSFLELKGLFKILPDVQGKERFILKTAERLALSESLVRDSFLKGGAAIRLSEDALAAGPARETSSPTQRKERYLLAHFLDDVAVYHRLRREMREGDLQDPGCLRLLELLETVAQKDGTVHDLVLDQSRDDHIQNLVAEAVSVVLPSGDRESDARACLRGLRRDRLGGRLQELTRRMRAARDETQRIALVREADAIRRQLASNPSPGGPG